MNWTDRHCRYFHRLLHPTAHLYTEMLHANAVCDGDREYLLGFDPLEHPVAVQLGGNDPQKLAQAARVCEDFGYDEVNLNIGCPSDRVQTGAFGACLMAQPQLVADCVRAMKAAVHIPVTVKTRIGIDDQDSDEFLQNFVEHMQSAEVDGLVIHARKALLSGLSPKQNREIPPLNYPRVTRIAGLFPDIPVVLNGGIRELEQVINLEPVFAGVMLGRAAYQNPWVLTQIATHYQVDGVPTSRGDVIREYVNYAEKKHAAGVPLQSMTRHVLGLFQGCPGARRWRRHLSEHSHRSDATPAVITDALQLVDP